MLKITGVELELLMDIDQHLFVYSTIHSRVAIVPNLHAAANNPLIPDQYDASKLSSFILYTNCNNLYFYTMSQPSLHRLLMAGRKRVIRYMDDLVGLILQHRAIFLSRQV